MAFLDNDVKVQIRGEFKDLKTSLIKKNFKDYSIMSMHTGFKQSDFAPALYG